MKGDKVEIFYLYVGLGVSIQDLDIRGERFKFNSGRERAEFRKILKKENPGKMSEVRRLYDLFIM